MESKISEVHLLGPMGGGKSTVASYLYNDFGFTILNLSQIVKMETEAEGLELNRENMNAIYDNLKKYQGNDIVAKRIVELANENEKVVFDGSRDRAEAEYMRKIYPNILSLYIDADKDIRMSRIIERRRDIDKGDLEKLLEKDEEYALTSKDIDGVIVIENNGTIDLLASKISELL